MKIVLLESTKQNKTNQEVHVIGQCPAAHMNGYWLPGKHGVEIETIKRCCREQ